jgi:hypothetical protein
MADRSDDSFLAVNYALRPNKVIARRILFDTLRRLSDKLDLRNAAYIGMGSIWFVDFAMAHRTLGITKMTSIEANPVGYRRAVYNAPFKCVAVKRGYTEDVLPTLPLESRSSVIWLDYDTPVDGPLLEDANGTIERCKEGSVVIFTVNASAKDLAKRINPKSPQKVRPSDIQRYLTQKLGDYAPTSLSKSDIEEENFPKVACGIIEAVVEGVLRRSGREQEFVKLFDFVYRDGPPMATVGGLLASSEIAAEVSKAMEAVGWPGRIQNTIRVPHLTLRERLSLDRMLPLSRAPSVRRVKKEAGFPLLAEQIRAYYEYYSHYPSFTEFQP